MAHPFPLPASEIPIVGQPFTIMANWPTVVVRCECEAKGIVVILGAKTPYPCPACGFQYAIIDEAPVRVARGPKVGQPLGTN